MLNAGEGVGSDNLNARYYDGGRGQFLSQDPVFWEVGQTNDGKVVLLNPQAQNSYSYGANNPIKNKDPDGRCGPLCAPLIIGAATYGPQILNYLSSLSTPLGQYAVTQAASDAQKGNYLWAAFGLLTAGEGSSLNLAKNNTLVKNTAGEFVPVFRGGELSFDLSRDFKRTYNAEKGVIDPSLSQKPEGISVNINPFNKDVVNHGGANQITSLPKGLRLVQSGQDAGHYVIQPTGKMSLENFNSTVNEMVKRIQGKSN